MAEQLSPFILTEAGPSGLFPETRSSILSEAASGLWTRFLDCYAKPCWTEVVRACRRRGIPSSEAADVFQELMVRLLRTSGFGRSVRAALRSASLQSSFQGNLPAKYLKYRELLPDSARFRTYLKGVIKNLVLEEIRRRRRRPRSLEDEDLVAIDASATVDLDRRWIEECLTEAAHYLRKECEAARTRGQRRLFTVLFRSIVKREPAAKIAQEFGVDRTTIADLLGRARQRFVEILQQITGVTGSSDLKKLLAEAPEALNTALCVAGTPTGRSTTTSA